MSCPAIQIQGITAEKFASLTAKAAAQGLNISSPAGNTNYQGMDFSWAYDEAAQTLTLQCTNKPFFIPCDLIESRIRSLVA